MSHKSPTRTFNHVHMSGLWDASEAQWNWAIGNATDRASVCSITETTARNPRGPKGWDGYHGVERPGANEGSIIWDGDVWEKAGPGFAEPVSKTQFALGNGKPRPDIHLIGIPLRHKVTGEVVVFSVVHTPSAVEGKGGLVQGARRALAYRETLAGIARVRRALRKQYKGCAFVVGGDWNVNLRLPWSKALLKAAMPGLKSSWRVMPSGKRGTHGTRVIDDARHSRHLAVVGTSRLMVKPAGFDHTPVHTTFRFLAK